MKINTLAGSKNEQTALVYAGCEQRMMYRVVYTITDVREESIEANSEDEAREEWESEVHSYDCDRELFFIEDEQGNQTIYD